MSARARKEWLDVAPELDRLGLAKNVDRTALEAYCEAVATHKRAVLDIQKRGIVIVNPQNGAVKRNPAVAIQAEMSNRIRAWASEFGLTPAAENRVNVAPRGGRKDDDKDDSGDPFAGSGS